MPPYAAAPPCPDCGGPMWSNVAKKASGEYPAKRSDYSCKDRACGKGIWLDKTPAAVQAPRSAAPQSNGASHAVAPTGIGFPDLAKRYSACWGAVIKMRPALSKMGVSVTPEDMTAMVATLFIQASRADVQWGTPTVAAPVAPPPPTAPPKRQEVSIGSLPGDPGPEEFGGDDGLDDLF